MIQTKELSRELQQELDTLKGLADNTGANREEPKPQAQKPNMPPRQNHQQNGLFGVLLSILKLFGIFLHGR